MPKHRVIYNDDFRSPISHDQVKFNFPGTVEEYRSLYRRVEGANLTTYVIDAIEYDNKVYFATRRGIDWAKIDFDSYGPPWRDGNYARGGQFIQQMRAEGYEPLQVGIDECRRMGLEVLAGVRMNDCHGLEPLSHESPDVSFYLKEHPQYAMRFPGSDEPTRLANFQHKALRDYRLSIIEELLDRFDFDGIELNWVRAPFLFNPDYVYSLYGYITEERFIQLAPIITGWLGEIRDVMDRAARMRSRGPLVLGVRVPETPELCAAVGIDLPAWIHEAQIDYVVPSGYHSTAFNIPVGRFKAMAAGSDCAVYPSLFPNVAHGPMILRTYQTAVYAAAASNYYAGGADGVEVFNHFHPACKIVGLPHNNEALHVISSPQAVEAYSEHDYLIPYSAEPADIAADVAVTCSTGCRGTRLTEHDRRAFVFNFAGELDKRRRRLTRLRFKIFEMAPEDGPPAVWLNDARLGIAMSWRQRWVCENQLVLGGNHDPDSIGWKSAVGSEGLELLAGEPIPAADDAAVRRVLHSPLCLRSQWLRRSGRGDRDGLGREVFMLVDVETGSVPTGSLRRGANRLWVQPGQRKTVGAQDLYMAEVEIVTIRC